MTGFHDDLLKELIKMIALEADETKPVIHIKVNLDKCWQLFEDEGGYWGNYNHPYPHHKAKGNQKGLHPL